jgi:hypothetical protein
MVAHLIMHYDIKAESDGVRPKNIHVAVAIMPDMQAKIMVRKRQNAPRA